MLSQGGHDSKADRDVDPALPPVFQARDEFQFTGDDLLQNIIAKSTSAFLDSVVQYAPTEPTSTEAQATVDEEGFSPHNHLHHMPVHAPHRKTISSDRRVGHPVADRHSFVSQHHGEVKRDRSVTMTLQRDYSDNLLPWDLSCSDAPQADPQEFFAAPNPAWSSTAPTNAPISRMPSSTGGCVCRPRSRVIQRPNVDYDGQNARVAESSVPRSESGQFAHDRPSQAVGREHFQSAAAALSPGATLNAAIEQASLLNMQNILGRQSGRPDASVAQVTQAGLPIANHHYHQQYQQGSYVYPSFDQSNGGGSEFTGSAAASARSEELNPLCRYLDTINLDSSAPARRSFDVTARARAQHRQPQKQQHDSKNWISFDEGTAQPMDNNEAWFLFLKQKRELQEQWQKGNYPRPTRPQHRSAPQEGRQRPKSSGASGRKESSNNRPVTDYIQHAPPQQQQQQQQQPADLLDGSLYELHHHGAVSSFSNGLMSSSRPRSATERSRPASVSARLHSAAIHNPSPPAAHSHSARFEGAPPSAGQHFNFSEATTEAMEAQDLSFQWPEQPQYGEVKIGQQIERLNTQHKVEPERKISGRARSAPRGGVRQSKAAAGVTQRRNKEQVIERLTAAYVNSVK